MATSSIFADFSIRDAEKAARFVDALDQSRQQLSAMTDKKRKSTKVRELHNFQEIKKFLAGSADD